MLSAMFQPVLRGIFPRHKERGNIGEHDKKRGAKMTDLNEFPKAKTHYPHYLRDERTDKAQISGIIEQLKIKERFTT